MHLRWKKMAAMERVASKPKTRAGNEPEDLRGADPKGPPPFVPVMKSPEKEPAPDGSDLGFSISSTTAAKQRSAVQQGRLDLGKSIAALYDELRRLKIFARGRRKTESDLRLAFPEFQLWREIDTSTSLPELKRKRFFEIRLDFYRQTQFMEFIGDIIAHEGETAYKIWKEYRNYAGLKRKRRASKAGSKSPL